MTGLSRSFANSLAVRFVSFWPCLFSFLCARIFSNHCFFLPEKELLDSLRTAEAAENRERTQRKLVHQAGLPTSGRGSASHWRHSDVLDWDVPPAGGGRGVSSEVGLTGGRQHEESRRQALVFERLRDSVRQIQEGRNSAGPVRFDTVRPSNTRLALNRVIVLCVAGLHHASRFQ